MITIIQYFEQPAKVSCDEKCHKAWGISSRPKVYLSDNPDDYEFLSDDELPEAPEDPGTYEGGHGKPSHISQAPNKWCARECERCVVSERGKFEAPLKLPDYSKRRQNIPKQDNTAD